MKVSLLKMADRVPSTICDLLADALKEKIENLEVSQTEGNEKGVGYLGELIFVSVKHKTTGEDHHFVIKQAIASKNETVTNLVSSTFLNEIHFYERVFPSLTDFQKSYPGVKVFDNIPTCYATTSEKHKEKIVLENLKIKNYEMHPKAVPLNTEMYEIIFKLYGKFHGLSLAFKNHHFQKFMDLAKPFKNNMSLMLASDVLKKVFGINFIKVQQFLKEENENAIMEKYQKYVDNYSKVVHDVFSAQSPYSVIVHGDCWSNNMMFKYNGSRDLEDIKIIDFQMCGLATPVVDLSYIFYSGATSEALDNLEKLLKIYHNSLSDTLKQYGCESEKIFPYEALKDEWKKYARFGLVLGIVVWALKTTANDQAANNLMEVMDEQINDSEEAKTSIFCPEEKTFKEATLNLLRHFYKNELL